MALGTALVVGGVIGGVIVGATQSSGSSIKSGSVSSSTVSACPVTSVADRVVPSVVTIAATGSGGGGTGSGEVIRSGGYILTNNHVIAIAANGGSVEVLFSDGQSAPATIVGRDPLTDLAVLRVQTSRQLKLISLGSSKSLKVGQPATSNVQLQELTLTRKPGATVPIDYTRGGRSATVTVTLTAQP
ncbi:MAG TPA: trypsin-like peptidase domain-containing protein [Streptosporangiaceae bacterium]|nr:trypsin-like peptidase domain-containing protein [Streptosporangiaceae bacterium]